jgi:hypothetical protein
MIYRMSRDLEENLRVRKYPVAITYGSRRLAMAGPGSYEIVIRRDDEAGDEVLPVQGSAHNPRKSCVRKLAAVATLYVSSPVSGAMVNDHEHLCDELADAFIVEALNWGTAAQSEVAFGETRYLTPAEYNEGEIGCGVVYRVRFEVSRGVTDKDFEGAGSETATVLGVSTASFVRVDGGTREPINGDST